MVAKSMTDERVEDILARLDRERRDPIVMRERELALRQEVAAFEARFGIPSSEIHAALDDGRLVESNEVHDWIMAHEILGGVGMHCSGRDGSTSPHRISRSEGDHTW